MSDAPAPIHADRANGRWRWAGVVLAVHYALVCVIKIDQGRSDEIWWLCHATLALVAAGFILESGTLLGMAFVGVLIPHTLWLADGASGAFFGVQYVGVTKYLRSADAATWISTCHHFYLIPLLWMNLGRYQYRPRDVILGMTLLYFILSGVSRIALPEQSNINYAHALFPTAGWRPFDYLNSSSWVLYLGALNTAVITVFFLPALAVLGHVTKARMLHYSVRGLTPSPAPP